MHPIERQLRTGHPILRVITLEEDGAVETVVAAAADALGDATRVYRWDVAVGLEPGDLGEATRTDSPAADLARVLERVAREPGPLLLVLRDAHRFLDDPTVSRRLLRLIPAIDESPVRVALVSPPGDLPPELEHEIPSVMFTLPSRTVLEMMVKDELGGEQIDGVDAEVLAAAVSGLTLREARLSLRRARADGVKGETLLTRMFEAKAGRVRQRALQFFPPQVTFSDVGGFKALKKWAEVRAPALLASRDDSPRGILLTGISGCGKSYAIKALSHAMRVPLFRLDMAVVFARAQPEAAYAAAVAAAETVSPCVLWLDEIENALALGAQDSGPSARIAGSFLTWLQERPPGVFVGATANRVELLPAELLRRGRFDQVWFVDLPDEEERKAVWRVHLRQRKLEPAHFDLIVLSRSTAGWSGAEIEATIESARSEALVHGKDEPSTEDLFRAIGQTVPLSVTMEEQIRRVREWAHRRALLASGKSW